MKTQVGIADRLACMIIGTALSIIGLIFTALGLTFLPVIGILIALPVMRLAFNFFRPGAWATATENNPVVEHDSSPWRSGLSRLFSRQHAPFQHPAGALSQKFGS
ncbi:MAG: hypothetical protein ABSH41_27375 [Syntrophobacteraceae bacterium]|jgi:hypothetical protein